MGIFPSNDPIQKLRLQRFFMALASYVLWCGFAYICYAAGVLVLPDTMVLPVAGGIACSNLYFYLMLRSGLNKRLDDPSMTFSQILVAMSWILVLIFSTSDHRGLMLTVYTMTMLFGIFQLEATGFLKLAAFGMFGYLCVVALDYTYFPWRFDPVGEGLRVVVLAGTLIWVSLFGAHVNTLKRALRARNRELADAVEEIGNAAKRELHRATNPAPGASCFRGRKPDRRTRHRG